MVQGGNGKPGRGRSEPAWAFDRCYRVLEHSFRVRSDLPRVGVLFDRYLAPFRAGDAGRGPVYVLTRRSGKYPFVMYRGRRRIQSAPTYADLLDAVFAIVHQDPIERTERFLAVHASAASWGGQGFVFPAPMDSGKTTLVAGLVWAGFDYLTDEAALFDAATGDLCPFPKVLWMEARSVRAIPDLQRKLSREYRDLSRLRSYVRPSDLRPASTGRRCRLRYVVFPSYDPDATTRIDPVGRPQALMRLARNSFNFKRFGAEGLRILRDALTEADCYTLRMGDLDSAVRAVQEVGRGAVTVA